jgi:putative FmdB family regulatory protein
VPTYSYRCANCDFAFDQHQEFTDDSLTLCPNCGQPQLRKVFNAIGVSFKGSGFYRNDSRAKPGIKHSKHGGSSSEKSTTSTPSTSGSSDAAAKPKTDKTPAAKPATTSATGSSGK